MKAIFPLLLCYVLMTSQSFALVGGPRFGGNSAVNPIGTFAGVLTPSANSDSETNDLNSLGLFTFDVPSTGLASGNFILFSGGLTLTGTIQASVDADSGTVLGVLNGRYRVVNAVINGVTYYNTLATAGGRVNGKVRRSNANSVSSARLSGTSLTTVTNYTTTYITDPVTGITTANPPSTVTTTYVLNGFRQSLSSSASTTTTTTSDTGTSGGADGTSGL